MDVGYSTFTGRATPVCLSTEEEPRERRCYGNREIVLSSDEEETGVGVVQTGRDRDEGRGVCEKVWKGSIGTTTSTQVEETDGKGSVLRE